jgi:hypothetical protein
MEEKTVNKNKALIITALIIILVGGAAFYGGIKYGSGKKNNDLSQNDFPTQGGQNFRNLTPEERQKRMAGAGANDAGFAGRSDSAPRGGFTAGEIIKKDEESITVKLADGGSKIIYLSGATEISMSTSGSKDNLEVGKNVMVTGSVNQDGSVAAQLVQIRPNAPKAPSESGQ